MESDPNPTPCAHVSVSLRPGVRTNGAVTNPVNWRCDACQVEFTLRPPANIEAMTLGDVEQLAKRLEQATQTFREAQSILGGSPAAHALRPGAVSVPTPPPRPRLTDEEQARKAALLMQNRPNPDDLPDDLRALEKAS